MYGFVDTIPGSGTGSTSMSLQTIFNGINLDEELTDENGSLITLTVSGRSNLTQKINTIEVPGMDGLIEQDGSKLEPREITVKYKISDRTNEGFRKRLDKLNSLLEGSKKELMFTDEDALFYATLLTNDIPEEESNNLVGTITFLCSDPFKYGPEKTVETTSDTFIVENEGTAEAEPIIELEVLQPTTFAMISNGDEYMMVGKPADVSMTVVNPKTELLYENGETIGDWTQTPPDWGGSEGTIGYDGAGITAPSYGTGTGYHGPSVFKEISATQDFEVELRGQLYTDHVNQTGRFGFFLFDEQMRQIAFMAAVDNSPWVNRKVAEGRIGPYIGEFKNYIVSSRNYQKEWDNFPAYLRLRRIGDTYTFYVARILGDGRHMEPLTASWTVWEDKFRGRLKYVGIFIEKYGDTQSPHTNRIDYIKVHALQQTTEDKTPYIAQPGDVIEFDHVTKDIRLNGESRKDLKAFGGSFFTLKNGINTLTVMPENTFNTKITYRERYK